MHFIRTLGIHYKKYGFSIKLLIIVIWNLETWKRKKIKNNIFDGPLIVNQTFSNLLLVNQILLILCIFIKQNVWNSWSFEIFAIKRWFPFNLVISYRAAILWWTSQKTFTRFFLIVAFKNYVVKFIAFSVYL